MNIPTYYPIYYSNTSHVSDAQRCLESKEFDDIQKKVLQDISLSEEETDRIMKCVEDRRNTTDVMAAVMAVALIVVVVGFIVAVCFF